jgi:hypothetical protein
MSGITFLEINWKQNLYHRRSPSLEKSTVGGLDWRFLIFFHERSPDGQGLAESSSLKLVKKLNFGDPVRGVG